MENSCSSSKSTNYMYLGCADTSIITSDLTKPRVDCSHPLPPKRFPRSEAGEFLQVDGQINQQTCCLPHISNWRTYFPQNNKCQKTTKVSSNTKSNANVQIKSKNKVKSESKIQN